MIDPPERITSHANPLPRRARALSRRKVRDEQGALLVEGIRPVWQALDHRAAIEVIILAPELLSSEAARGALEQARRAGIPVAEVSAAVFERLSEREHASGLAAIVRAPSQPLGSLPVPANAVFAALHEVGNPGNLGAILRTLDAMGGSGLIIMGEAADPYHPGAVKASMGTLFSVPIARVARPEDALAWARTRGIQVVGATEHAGHIHWEAPLPLPCLLVLGSEGRGLPPDLLAACDLCVRIPMMGTSGSLNLAVAAALLLYEMRRGRWAQPSL